MQDVKKIIKENSLVITGGNVNVRTHTIDLVKNSWKRAGKTGVFQLSSSINDRSGFIKSIVKNFPVTSPLKGMTKERMNWNQVNDYFLEWPHELKYDSALVILPEFHQLLKSDSRYFEEIMFHFFKYTNWLQWADLCELKILVTSQDRIEKSSLLDDKDSSYNLLPAYFKHGSGRASKSFDQLIKIIAI